MANNSSRPTLTACVQANRPSATSYRDSQLPLRHGNAVATPVAGATALRTAWRAACTLGSFARHTVLFAAKTVAAASDGVVRHLSDADAEHAATHDSATPALAVDANTRMGDAAQAASRRLTSPACVPTVRGEGSFVPGNVVVGRAAAVADATRCRRDGVNRMTQPLNVVGTVARIGASGLLPHNMTPSLTTPLPGMPTYNPGTAAAALSPRTRPKSTPVADPMSSAVPSDELVLPSMTQDPAQPRVLRMDKYIQLPPEWSSSSAGSYSLSAHLRSLQHYCEAVNLTGVHAV